MALGAMTWNPRPLAEDPSAWMLIMASAFASVPILARSHVQGPHASREFDERVNTTVAPFPSSSARRRLATRQLKVASGRPAFVAVPVVLQPLTIDPLNFVALISLANFGFELPS